MKTILKANITLIFSIIFLFNNFVNVNSQDTGQWEILSEGGNFWTIDFINDDIGWVAGEGTLMKTEDGGETWQNSYWLCRLSPKLNHGKIVRLRLSN